MVSFGDRLLRPDEAIPWVPRANIYRTGRGWLIKMDLAGVQPSEVIIRPQGTQLIVSGSRRDQIIREGWQLYEMEIFYSGFERVIQLPQSLEGTTLRSDYREGMLLIEVIREGADEEA
jgi:HSP20 family protein